MALFFFFFPGAIAGLVGVFFFFREGRASLFDQLHSPRHQVAPVDTICLASGSFERGRVPLFFLVCVYRMDSRRLLFAVVLGCCQLVMEEGIAVEKRSCSMGPSPWAKGLLDPAFDGELPCDLSHERHRQALPDFQEGSGLWPTSQVGRCPLGDLKQHSLG